LLLQFYYDPGFYNREAVEMLARRFGLLLRQCVSYPETSLRDFDIVTEEEREQIVVGWNATHRDYPLDKCVHHLFEQQVLRSPHAVALTSHHPANRLSYSQLNARANRLAHYLQTLGVGPEVVVGICMERSIEMVVGLLGILKAGGAYMPLDPTYPPDRLSYMMSDAGARVLLTHHQLPITPSSLSPRSPVSSVDQLLPQWHQQGVRIILLSQDTFQPYSDTASTTYEEERPGGSNSREEDEEEETSNPTSGVGPENLIYVIYTSGSTGSPKGTMLDHRSVANYLHWCNEAYTVKSGTGAPLTFPLTFDASVTSLFSPLCIGQQLVLYSGDDIEILRQVVSADTEFTFLKLTPAQFSLIDELGQEGKHEPIGSLILGGEALWAENISDWRDSRPKTRIFNEYGPTEAAVGCCVYEVRDETARIGAVPIGRPIANLRLYILDTQMQPVPPGVTGELYIGGIGLARGYLNRPQLTAEKFLPSPFSAPGGSRGERLYRSGDLAKYLPDGTIEFLGRIDHQVKIRGFRIELGEIEALLTQHPLVQEAVVLALPTPTPTVATANPEGNPDRRLVAYLVLNSKQEDAGRQATGQRDTVRATRAAVVTAATSVTASNLRGYLREKLPEYMVPAVFVFLPAFPLSPNGKIDRKGLPTPEQAASSGKQPLLVDVVGVDEFGRQVPYEAARTAVEEELVRIWAELLGLAPAQVGIHDNFFESGGHSLLAVQVISRIRDFSSVDVPLSYLFQHPTVAGLAVAINIGQSLTERRGLAPDDVGSERRTGTL
ncbi:MAG: amino acid adenylation domain-containing protein, partial [Chloroflexia bacterium]